MHILSYLEDGIVNLGARRQHALERLGDHNDCVSGNQRLNDLPVLRQMTYECGGICMRFVATV